jgi:hypothetical protein
MPDRLLRQPSFAALVMLVWLLVALALLLQNWDRTAQTLLDTDDAMRLAQLHDWLRSPSMLQSWFDLHQARMDPPAGYDTHWSRLIDAGLAGLLFLFRLFTDAASAERLMRAWWPLLWLLPTITGMTMIAWRIAGREAATVSLLLALVGVPGYVQFAPGRIDHHNVQIALTILALAATVWADRWRWGALAAGALSGMALTIGFECAPYLAGCGAAFALRYVSDEDNGGELATYGRWLVASAGAGFFLTIGPQFWLRHTCDSIAVNTLAAIVGGGVVLVLAGWLKHRDKLTRLFAVAGAAAVAIAALFMIEPACSHGPFGMVDPAIWPIWLSEVREMQPLVSVFQKNPLTGAAIAAFPALAVLATMLLLNGKERHDAGFLTAAGVFMIAVAVTFGAIRGFSYAIWFGMPMVAAMALRMFAALNLVSIFARACAALFLTPLVMSSSAITVVHASGGNDRDPFDRPGVEVCRQTASYARLAKLSPGLVATDVSFGPFLLALTPHSALAGPYHHLSKGIIAAHRSLALPPKQAHEVIKQTNADYVMVCGSRPPDGLAQQDVAGSLWGQLRAGVVPDWLEPDAGNAGHPFAVFRVKR